MSTLTLNTTISNNSSNQRQETPFNLTPDQFKSITMLDELNKPIVREYASIQTLVQDNAQCETLEQEVIYMVNGGKERIYLAKLATKLTGTLINKLSSDVVEEDEITVYAVSDGDKQPRPQKQSLNASLYMVGLHSVALSGYTNADIIESALINWIDEDSVSITINARTVAENMVKQFQKDNILETIEKTATYNQARFPAFGVTLDIANLRIETMFNLWDKATPKMKPMLHKITWNWFGECELPNFAINETVTQHYINALNIAGHTGYKVNGAIRAEIKRKLKRGAYPKDQIQAMKEMLRLDPSKVYYFPHTCDYRGRFYARGGLTTFQGVKDIRACFDFAESTKVDEYGLFLHIANAHGYDKASITDRMQWVQDNHIALMTTKNPNLYAERARLAYIEYKETGLSNVICRIDGTCSGVQITSGLFKDSNTAKAVNVSASSPDDKPSDCYGIVADSAIKLAKKGTDKAILTKYHRDITKDVIMILAYGAGENTLIDTIRTFLIVNKERASNAKSLYKVIMQAIETNFSAITKLNDHLQIELEMSPLSKLQYDLEDIRVNIAPRNTRHLNLHGTSYTAKLVGKSLEDPEALARGLAPNFVHSLDSLLLRKAVVNIGANVSCIHDDLGLQSGMVRIGLQAVRTAYVEVIKAEPLKALYTGMGIIEEYEPEDNGLDINEALESTYLFS